VLGVNSGATGLEYKTITAGVGLAVTHGANSVTISTSGAFRVLQQFAGGFTAATGTSSIPVDNTIPLSTEGTQVWSQVITPSATSSTIRLSLLTQLSTATGDTNIVVSLFRGTTCIAAYIHGVDAIGFTSASTTWHAMVPFEMVDSPATTAATTYSLRVGITSGTWYFGRGSSATLAGANTGSYIVQEISA
jgi:hypothetical protein